MARNNEEKNVLLEVYGSKAFLKVKQCLEIGKIQFSFVNKNNSKQCIDCYMEAEEFGACLMKDIEDKSLFQELMKEKAKGEEYPKAVWTSPVGGNATGNNGKPLSRYFEISPAGSGTYEVLFTAKAYPAEKNSTGAFIKKKGSKPIFDPLRVPCMFKDLSMLQYKWSFLEQDYMRKKYNMENMKSSYSPTASDVDEESNHYYDDGSYDSKSNIAEELEYNDNQVPFVGAEKPKAKEKEKAKPSTEIVELTATTELCKIENKDIKICHVSSIDGTEYRLVCLTNKISDERFSDFEQQLKNRVSNQKTLKFKANVCKKENDLYLLAFA